jgi:hypothetical protein
MKKTLAAAILLCLLAPSLAEAQVPTPPDVPTLGPPIIVTSGDSGTNVKILSPKTQAEYPKEVQLDISIEAVGMLGQFGNVGYSLDGGTIYSIRNMTKSVDKSGFPEWDWWKTTAGASLSLLLSDGFHAVTVYYGWQYPKEFDVFAYSTVDFLVGNASITPEIWIKSPSDLTLTMNNSVLLSFYLRNIQNMATSASIYYSLDGKNYSISDISESSLKSVRNNVTPFNQKIDNLTDGSHILSVYAEVYYMTNWLFEGNSSIQFAVDTSAPIISELSIANKTYNNQPIPLTFNLNEKTSWIAYNLDDQGNVTTQGNMTLSGLAYGIHKIIVYANDTAGNMNASPTVTFTLAKPEFFTISTFVSVSIVALVAVFAGLLIYLKKNNR